MVTPAVTVRKRQHPADPIDCRDRNDYASWANGLLADESALVDTIR